MAKGKSGRGIGFVVISAMVAAVFPVLPFQKLFPRFRVRVLAEKGEYIQPGPECTLMPTQRLVDFIIGNEIPPQRVKALGGGKNQGRSLQIFQLLQKLGRVIQAAYHKAAIIGMGRCKHGPFLYEPVQRIRGFQKPLHLGLDFWKASLGRIGIHSQGEIPGFFHLCGTLSYRKRKGLGKSAPLKVRNLIQFRLGHIPPHIQQFPDTLCGLFPGDNGGIQFLNRAPGGDANALRVIPDGVLLPLDD